MKRRYRYSDCSKMEVGAYYKILQELTWRFYFRFIKGYKGWFTPCTKCQEVLDEEYLNCPTFEKEIPYLLFNKICKFCRVDMYNSIDNAEEVIFGNSNYEPLLEVSRLWLDNDDEVHEVTKEEYEKERSYKYL